MRLEACRSVSVKCIWEILRKDKQMIRTVVMTAIYLAVIGGLPFGAADPRPEHHVKMVVMGDPHDPG